MVVARLVVVNLVVARLVVARLVVVNLVLVNTALVWQPSIALWYLHCTVYVAHPQRHALLPRCNWLFVCFNVVLRFYLVFFFSVFDVLYFWSKCLPFPGSLFHIFCSLSLSGLYPVLNAFAFVVEVCKSVDNISGTVHER